MPALLLLAATALPAQILPDDRGDRLVKVELLADRAAIRPGESFSLGVRLRIEPKWHIYWEHHGDSGIPTRAELESPPGFEVGPPRFPGPERDVAEGDIVSYIHHGEIVLVLDAKAPDPIPPGLERASFAVDASWLVCTEACFAGSGHAELELPIAAAGSAPAPANAKLFTEARARLPKPWAELRGATIEWRGDARAPIAVFTVPGASDLELFPLASESTTLVGRAIEPMKSACRLAATLRFKSSAPGDAPRLEGVLRVRQEQGEAFYRLDTSPNRPADPAGSHPTPKGS